MDVKFELKGAKEFANLLSKLPMEMEKTAVLSALRSAAGVVKKAVVQKAPVYQGHGHSIHTTATWANTGSNFVKFPGTLKRSIVVRKNAKKKLSYLVGTGKAFYGHFVEWGTQAHTITAGRHRAHRFPKWMAGKDRKRAQSQMPGMLADSTTGQFFGKTVHHPGARKHPFLVPALESSKADMVRKFGQTLATSLNKEAGRLIAKYNVIH